MKKLTHSIQRMKVISTLPLFIIMWCVLSLTTSNVTAQTDYELARRTGNITVTEVTRAQLTAMTHVEMREKLYNFDFYKITDLVNATPALKQSRQDNLFYLTVEQFNQADPQRKMHMLQNSDLYIIFNNESEIPKTEMSKQYFNSLPAEKQQGILNSGQFTITD